MPCSPGGRRSAQKYRDSYCTPRSRGARARPCTPRARLGQRQRADRLARCLSLDAAGREPADPSSDGSPAEAWTRVDEYLREDHPLLSRREKAVLQRRFGLTGRANVPTLEKLGRDL